jgi:hypothetical protein
MPCGLLSVTLETNRFETFSPWTCAWYFASHARTDSILDQNANTIWRRATSWQTHRIFWIGKLNLRLGPSTRKIAAVIGPTFLSMPQEYVILFYIWELYQNQSQNSTFMAFLNHASLNQSGQCTLSYIVSALCHT